MPRKYPEAYEPYYDQMDFYNGRDAWLISIAGVPKEAVNLYTLHWLHLEVHNGGFAQYFANSTGVTAPEARRGYAAIGMPEVADIVDQAMQRLAEDYPFDRDERINALEARRESGDQAGFNDLDHKFYDLADTKKFFRRVPNFVPFAEAYAQNAAHRAGSET